MFQRRAIVLIRQDQMTETTRVVWVHEIPFLRELFGEGAVKVVRWDQQAFVSKEIEQAVNYPRYVDTAEELDRLRACFGRHPDNGEEMVNVVLGRMNPQQRLEELGCAQDAGPYSEAASVRVPGFVDLQVYQAIERLGRSGGLTLGEVLKEHSDAAEGTVLSQTPDEGVEVEEGTKVSFVVSAGYKKAGGRPPKVGADDLL